MEAPKVSDKLMKLRAKKRTQASSTNVMSDEYNPNATSAGRFTQLKTNGGDPIPIADEDDKLVGELAERNVRTQGEDSASIEGVSRNHHVSSHYQNHT